MEDQLIVCYIEGLKLVIQDLLAIQGVWTMIDVVNLAIKWKVKSVSPQYSLKVTFTNQPKKLLLLQRGQQL